MTTATDFTQLSATAAALVPGIVVADVIVTDRAPWSGVVATGDTLTIVDLYGNQAVDTLFYGAADHSLRYRRRRRSPRRATSS